MLLKDMNDDYSCEEILSAGKYFACEQSRVTNYSIAFSKRKEDWEKYISREDDLILKRDEYGETVIDYAMTFGAGTIIERKNNDKLMLEELRARELPGLYFAANIINEKR